MHRLLLIKQCSEVQYLASGGGSSCPEVMSIIASLGSGLADTLRYMPAGAVWLRHYDKYLY